MHRTVRFLPALLLALTGAACSGGAPVTPAAASQPASQPPAASQPPVAAPATIEATEFAFKPPAVELSAGGSATITLVNKGVVEHDITVDATKLQILAKPGETVSGTATFAAGMYEFYCSIPGHKQAGMIGTFTVK